MSVKGEFVRLVGDAAASLRGGPGEADALADALERARAGAGRDLDAAAASVLELWRDAPADALELPDGTRAELDEAAERMLAVARIIRGS